MRIVFLTLFLLLVTVGHASPGQIHYVGPLQADVKEGPSADSQTKFIIAIGRKVIEFERRGDWVSVGIDKSGGKEGWIHLDDLKSTDPDGMKY